jgi:hypothetical protein
MASNGARAIAKSTREQTAERVRSFGARAPFETEKSNVAARYWRSSLARSGGRRKRAARSALRREPSTLILDGNFRFGRRPCENSVGVRGRPKFRCLSRRRARKIANISALRGYTESLSEFNTASAVSALRARHRTTAMARTPVLPEATAVGVQSAHLRRSQPQSHTFSARRSAN